MTAPTACVAAALSLVLASRTCAFRWHHAEMRAALDFGSDDILVPGDFVRIDLAVMIDVKKREKALSILHHLVERQIAVMIPIGLREPVGERVVAAVTGAKWLAHGTDEQTAPVAGLDRDWLGRGLRGGGHQDQGSKERHCAM